MVEDLQFFDLCMFFFQIVVGLEPPSPETGILVLGKTQSANPQDFLAVLSDFFYFQKKLGGKQFPC